MAESVLFNFAGDIIIKLGSLAFQEIGLHWGVGDELGKLKNTVSTIQAVLLDAEEQQANSNQVRDWLGKLKDAMFDADDLLDEFATEALQQRMVGRTQKIQVCTFLPCSSHLFCGPKKNKRVREIRKKLDAIASDKKFHLVEHHIETCPVSCERESTQSFIQAQEVVGRDTDSKEIIELLLDSQPIENVSVIAIVGIGGVGKTTLAQLVYNDDKVKNHFDLKMWVCVSKDFDVKMIVEKMIKSATCDEVKNLEMDQLQILLRKEIDGRRYLLVLDDVWNDDREKWLSLEKFLMGGARGSRIIVTTRAEKIAKMASTISPFALDGLPENESWSLFTKMAFQQGQVPNNPTLVEIGKEIVKSCAGVPLVIRTIGSLLYCKSTETEWLSFKNNHLAKIAQQEGNILKTLKLSYDHLPSHLKICFAYCGIFPKNHEINVQTLINFWVGQGFIKLSDPCQCPEDVGHEYFMDLLGKSFFHEAEKDEWGNIRRCKMHDLMHDLAITALGWEGTRMNSNADIIGARSHHVPFDVNLELTQQTSGSCVQTNRTRTFLSPGQLDHANRPGNSTPDMIVKRFKRLRVLDLHDSGIETVPRSIGMMKHLRYLDLSQNHAIKMLPSSICQLQNLQVLNLFKCSSLKELPKDIQKLISLRHLDISGCDKLTCMPSGLGHLAPLQTLTMFVVAKESYCSMKNGELGELNGLNSLRGELVIVNLAYMRNPASESKSANLKGKPYLRCLRLEWNRDDNDSVSIDDEMSLEGLQPHPNLKQLYVYGWGGRRFGSWISLLPNVVKITIKNCGRCQYLPPMRQLPFLKVLWLQNLTDLEYVENGVDWINDGKASTFFPSLKEILFCRCYNLKGWWKMDDYGMSITKAAAPTALPSFPCLSRLAIKFCPNLYSMPLFPYLDEELRLDHASVKPMLQTMIKVITSPTALDPSSLYFSSCSCSSSLPSLSPSSPPPLSKLKSLYMWGIEDVESLPEEGLQNFTSLQRLTIMNCPRLMNLPGKGFMRLTSLRSLCIFGCEKLKSLSGLFQHLTVLEELEIGWCEQLDFSNSMIWKDLWSLSSLKINGLPQLVSLPLGLQHVTTLRRLQVYHCRNLTSLSGAFWHLSLPRLENLEIRWCKELILLDAGNQFQNFQGLQVLHLELQKLVFLPEWLQHVSNLQILKIINCQNLTTLPEWIGSLASLQTLIIHDSPMLNFLPDGMQRLTSLQQLIISKCPNLSARCRRGIGEDWPKITHVQVYSEEISSLELFSD